jgi:antitoxin component of MazEF toxin-antitoxin module
MVKIQQLPSGQLVITIPKLLAEYENLEKGMEIEFKKHEDGFLLEIRKEKKTEEGEKIDEN